MSVFNEDRDSRRYPKLSNEQKQTRDILEKILHLIDKLRARYNKLQVNCNHQACRAPLVSQQDLNTMKAECVICFTELDWVCPYSPDNVCHYEVEQLENNELGVEMVDHTMFIVTQRFTHPHQSDNCLFCQGHRYRK